VDKGTGIRAAEVCLSIIVKAQHIATVIVKVAGDKFVKARLTQAHAPAENTCRGIGGDMAKFVSYGQTASLDQRRVNGILRQQRDDGGIIGGTCKRGKLLEGEGRGVKLLVGISLSVFVHGQMR